MIDFVDCQGLGGGMTLGVVQAGGHLVHKVEQAGAFGVPQMLANQHLLGVDWTPEDGNADTWTTMDVPLVIGNPPCSGFSLMNSHHTRGIDNAINSCMWDLVDYGRDCDADIIMMESVQQAGRAGLELMRSLRERAGAAYTLYHCYHNGVALGGSSVRRRYFMVLSRIPFGVETDCVRHVPWLIHSIGDIAVQANDPHDEIVYVRSDNWWTKEKRNYVDRSDVVGRRSDGHITYYQMHPTDHGLRIQGTLDTGLWHEGTAMDEALHEYFDETGEFPEHWSEQAQYSTLGRSLDKCVDWDAIKAGTFTVEEYMTKWKAKRFPNNRPEPFAANAYSPRRWRADRAGRVIAGNGLNDVVHPWLDRTLTYREVARLMGFPDSWDVSPYWESKHGAAVFGKGVIVEAGEWIGRAALAAIEGEPFETNTDYVEQLGDREYEINITNIHKGIYNERTGERT